MPVPMISAPVHLSMDSLSSMGLLYSGGDLVQGVEVVGVGVLSNVLLVDKISFFASYRKSLGIVRPDRFADLSV